MSRMFGTDGVRGIANTELTPERAFELGRAGAYVLTNERHRPKILIGRDTRISGNMLEAAMVAGITSMGADVLLIGVLPTPAIAFLTRYYSADAGVMISASHNPVEDNGIKFFDSRGYKLADCIEDRIEEIITKRLPLPKPTGQNIGRVIYARNAHRDYMDFLKESVDVSLEGLKIAVDCANGASSAIAVDVLSELGAEVHPAYNMPDGININKNCGSTHPDVISRIVVESGADVGMAFDGDADRIIVADERGGVLDGDKIMTICALDMKANGTLKNDTLVTTVMSNMGVGIALKPMGCTVISTNVGDRYVLEKMLKDGFNLGGEASGHIIFLDHNSTGDGLLAGLKLLSILVRSGKSMSDLGCIMKHVPQVLKNVKINNESKDDFMADVSVSGAIQDYEQRMRGRGRILIRLSGTEPLVRVMVEGIDADEIEAVSSDIAKFIESKYGVSLPDIF